MIEHFAWKNGGEAIIIDFSLSNHPYVKFIPIDDKGFPLSTDSSIAYSGEFSLILKPPTDSD